MLLLDEPFAAVDEATTRILLDLILAWGRDGRTVIAVLHDLAMVRAHFPQTLVLAGGPWPEARATYEERSPIFHTDRIDRPLAVFQGLDDPVVPPNQAEMIVGALREKGVPVSYLAFEGEMLFGPLEE